MRGVNPVPDYLETVAGILEDDRDFTDREPVYALDPAGSLFWTERPSQLLPIGAVVPDAPERRMTPRWVAGYARHRLDRSFALRINEVIGDFNAFGELAIQTMRQLAEANRKLESELRLLAQQSRRSRRALSSRIDELESEIERLRGDGDTE